MWATSMLGWYENREAQVVLPESLKHETQTQILTTEKKEEENNQTVGYCKA
jgi:hypothetical protein